MQCDGSEARLEQCSHNGIGVHNCGHQEDAGVICTGNHRVLVPGLVVENIMLHLCLNVPLIFNFIQLCIDLYISTLMQLVYYLKHAMLVLSVNHRIPVFGNIMRERECSATFNVPLTTLSHVVLV